MHRLHDKLCKQHGFISPGPVYKLSSVCPRFQAMASPAYIRALEEIKIYDVAQYEVPLFLRQDDTFGCVDDLPLKHLAPQTEAKSFLDIIKDAPLDNVDFGLLEGHMLQNKYDDLPAPFATKVPLHKSYKMQIAIMKSSMMHCLVLRQFIIPEKTPRPAFTRMTRKVRTID